MPSCYIRFWKAFWEKLSRLQLHVGWLCLLSCLQLAWMGGGGEVGRIIVGTFLDCAPWCASHVWGTCRGKPFDTQSCHVLFLCMWFPFAWFFQFPEIRSFRCVSDVKGPSPVISGRAVRSGTSPQLTGLRAVFSESWGGGGGIRVPGSRRIRCYQLNTPRKK